MLRDLELHKTTLNHEKTVQKLHRPLRKKTLELSYA